MFFFFSSDNYPRERIKNKKLLKKKKFPEIVTFPFFPLLLFSLLYPPSLSPLPSPPLSPWRRDKTFSIIRYFYLYFIVYTIIPFREESHRRRDISETASFSRNLAVLTVRKVQSGI